VTVKIVILGAGQMGTAFAQYLARKGIPVHLWMRRNDQYESIVTKGTNEEYFPALRLDDKISYSTDLASSLENAKLVILAIPSSAISEFNIAKEIAYGLPTTTTIACEDEEVLAWLMSLFDSDLMKVYPSRDLVGTELCGSLKNVVTVAVGLVDGLHLGENMKGVVVASGFYEIGELIENSGGLRETRFSPAGLEDLLVASYSGRSRNYRLGKMLGEGKSMSDIESEFGHITFEGIKTVRLTWILASELGITTPLVNCVYELITGAATAREAFEKFWKNKRDHE